MKINLEKVLLAARNNIPLTIKTHTLPHETELQLEEILEVFLREMGQEALKDALAYCLRELAVNAKKANTKRVYFVEKNLDIANETDYDRGMTRFKQETLDNIGHYLQKQKEADLYVKIVFHAKAQNLHIYVANNTRMTRKEQIRVFDRIARSRAFSSMEEALTTVLDDSEGAGLGIVILVLMLKRIGLSEGAFEIDVTERETVAHIKVPMSDVRVENLNQMSQRLIQEIDSLPQFPENIVRLQSMINDPNTEFSAIARTIGTDPALTADMLKLVNSAAFMLTKRVDNIVEAVKLVGLRALRNLLYSYGTQKVLSHETEETKALWAHSHQAGFYSYQITKGITRIADLVDDAYVGGILHDMGKIIFAAVHPNIMARIDQFCQEKDIPVQLFEDLSSGLNHAEIGAMIAEKWNFPEALVQAIRYHHDPSSCDQAYQPVVNTVYLANALCSVEAGRIGYEQMDPTILRDFFRITGAEQLATLSRKLSIAFKREQQNQNLAAKRRPPKP